MHKKSWFTSVSGRLEEPMVLIIRRARAPGRRVRRRGVQRRLDRGPVTVLGSVACRGLVLGSVAFLGPVLGPGIAIGRAVGVGQRHGRAKRLELHLRDVRIRAHRTARLDFEPGDEGLGRELGSVLRIRRGRQIHRPRERQLNGGRRTVRSNARGICRRNGRGEREVPRGYLSSQTGGPEADHHRRRSGDAARVRLRHPDQPRRHRAQRRRLPVPAPRPSDPRLHGPNRSEGLPRAPRIRGVPGLKIRGGRGRARRTSRNESAGAPDRIRSCDLRLRGPTLYPLSYRRAATMIPAERDASSVLAKLCHRLRRSCRRRAHRCSPAQRRRPGRGAVFRPARIRVACQSRSSR